MIKCPHCGSTEFTIASNDITLTDKTDFGCMECGEVFFVMNGKIYTEQYLKENENVRMD